MNKLITITLLLLWSLSGISYAADYQEGTHYVKVKGIEATVPEVREYFSFYCPHCYSAEPLMASIKKHLPDGVSFIKNHVDFLPGASHKMQQMLTKSLISAQILDVEETQVAAIFKYIHVHRAVFTSQRDVRNVFILNGIDGENFDQVMASEAVATQTKLMHDHQHALSDSGGLTSVPAVIINGKYRLIAKELDKANFEQDYNRLVKYLLSLD